MVLSLKFLLLQLFFVCFRDENEVVPRVVESILTLPPTTHIAVKQTSLLLLGELSEWIEQHPQSLGTLCEVYS